jgi:hypothetical protein
MAYICVAKVNCFTLLEHDMAWALDFALANAGRSIAARIAMIAITTSNSISVKAERFGLGSFVLTEQF